METALRYLLAMLVILAVCVSTMHGQQNDTSSYFPLGLWGIWIDQSKAPFNPSYLTAAQWQIETANWNNIHGNYLIYWMPSWEEQSIMSFADQNSYRMDIANSNYWSGDTLTTNSLVYWIYYGGNDTNKAISTINYLKNQWQNHPGFYTYSFGQEGPVANSAFWPRVEFLSRKIHELDPGRRSYMVSGGAPPTGFVDATPHLDILQMDTYTFFADRPQAYSAQQQSFDELLNPCNSMMNQLKGKNTEWQLVMQAHREYHSGCTNLRRPNFYELRAQAYLGISRGSRGITSFVYGSLPVNEGSQSNGAGSTSANILSSQMLHGTLEADCSIVGYVGLVDPDRNKYSSITDPDGIAGFDNLSAVHNELKILGPTIRKLRVYDAFPNTAIPSNNIAKITQIVGDKIEIGVFKRIDQGADSTVHFMLVNRVCNNTDGTLSSPQTVTTTFSLPSGNYEISEVVSGKIWIIANNGSFSDVFNPGSGKLYRIGPATWAGTKSVTGTATIASGAVLTVSPGASVTIRNSAALLVNGQLSAVGTSSQRITFDFLAPSSSAGNGIAFASGSSGSTISYCRVLRADRGIYENGVSINVTNSAIDSCTNGIYLYNSSPTIQNNSMYGNSYAGISLTASSPTLYNNYIQNNQYGVHCITSSNPQFGNGSTQGKNNITGNSYGVFCWDNSFPMLGRNSPLNGGYNNLVNTLWNVYNMSGYPNYANNNWWGTTNPANFKINGTGTVLYNPYLTSSVNIPAPPLSKSSVNVYASNGSDIPMLSELDTAYQLIAANRLIEARKICLNLVTNYPDDGVSGIALNLLRQTYPVSDVASVKDVYLSLFNSKEKNNLYAMAGLILADIDKENRLSLIDDVINAYKSELSSNVV